MCIVLILAVWRNIREGWYLACVDSKNALFWSEDGVEIGERICWLGSERVGCVF